MDDDGKYPTICGTGTEDYFCGSYDFDTEKKNAAGLIVELKDKGYLKDIGNINFI